MNAVLLPSWIAPKQVHRIAARRVAGTGQLSFSLTREKKPEKGVALSRARAHQIRPTCTCQNGSRLDGKKMEYCEECAKHTDHDGEKDYQEKAEGSAFVAGCLGVDDRERKGSVAAYDG